MFVLNCRVNEYDVSDDRIDTVRNINIPGRTTFPCIFYKILSTLYRTTQLNKRNIQTFLDEPSFFESNEAVISQSDRTNEMPDN